MFLVKPVGLPTYTSKKPFFGYQKTVFPDIFVRWAASCPLGSFFGAFLEAPRRVEMPVLLFVSPNENS
jgi:hypothetical protein